MLKTRLLLMIGLTLFTLTSHKNSAQTPDSKATESPVVQFSISISGFENNARKESDFIVELYPKEAPKTVENFLSYVKEGFYNNTIFHRVINEFMIQGGGFKVGMKAKNTNPPIRNEAHNKLENKPYTLAMARTHDVHSATSQFFINLEDNEHLNHQNTSKKGYGYCVFGKVIDGAKTIEMIKSVPTSSYGNHQNIPINTVTITNVKILRKGDLEKKNTDKS